MHRKIVLAGLVASLGVAAPPAAAEKVVEAQTTWHFDAMTYTIDQGESLVFHNRDTASPGPHNVTAADNGPDGKPLFQSKTISNGEDAPVVGATQLKTGSYSFMCTVHPFMTATLNVTDQGTPEPAPAPAPAPDTTAPKLRVALKAASTHAKTFTATVTSDEAAALTGRLTAHASGHTFTVGTASASSTQAGQRVTLKIHASKAARHKLARAKRATLTLTVKARDAAGNASTATAHRAIKRSG